MQLRLHVTREALSATSLYGSSFSAAFDPDPASGGGGGGSTGSLFAPHGGGDRLPLLAGRPDPDALMAQMGREAGRPDRPGRGIAVVCCGPRPMVKEVGRQVLFPTHAPHPLPRVAPTSPHSTPASYSARPRAQVNRHGFHWRQLNYYI